MIKIMLTDFENGFLGILTYSQATKFFVNIGVYLIKRKKHNYL